MFVFPARCSSIQNSSSRPLGNWQGEEPMAERRRSFWCSAAILRNEGNELLHRPLRSIACSWCARCPRLGPCSWPSDREAKIFEHRSAHEICQSSLKSPIVVYVPIDEKETKESESFRPLSSYHTIIITSEIKELTALCIVLRM